VLPERLSQMSRVYGVRTRGSNRDAVESADAVFLAVKPPVADAVLEDIGAVLPPHAMLLSIVAGLRTSRIEQRLGGEPRVIRAMPNTPALVGSGATGYCAGRWAKPEDLVAANTWLGSVGVAMEVVEDLLDAVTALSGSGPAYVCVLVEAMLDAASRMGLSADVARTLTLQTLLGTARMLQASGDDPAEARKRVTSKGGTTEAALKVLVESGVPEAFRSAIEAARDRSLQLITDH